MKDRTTSEGESSSEQAMAPKLHHLPSVYFLHIPKTAGTSFRSWLDDLFSTTGRLPADHLSELQEQSSRGLPSMQFYSGHFGWRLMELAEDAGLQVVPITILRDPLSHYRSGFNFIAVISDEAAEKLGPNRRNDMAVATVKLQQARELGSAISDQESLSEAGAGEVAQQQSEPKTDPGSIAPVQQVETPFAAFKNVTVRNVAHYGTEVEEPITVTPQHLETAKQHLASMPFFGLSSDWARSTVLFADAFRLPLRDMDRNENAQPAPIDPSKLPPAFGDKVDEFNALDFEFYDYAVKLFNERYAAVAARHSLPEGAPPDAFRDALKRQFIDAGKDIPASSRVRQASIPITAGLITHGFNHRYPDKRCGWRLWSGPELYSAIYLPMDRSVARLVTVRVNSVLTAVIIDSMQFLVDGELVSGITEYVQNDDGSYDYLQTIVVPPSQPENERGYTEVGIRVVETMEVPETAFRTAISFALTGEIVIRPAPAYSEKTKGVLHGWLTSQIEALKFW